MLVRDRPEISVTSWATLRIMRIMPSLWWFSLCFHRLFSVVFRLSCFQWFSPVLFSWCCSHDAVLMMLSWPIVRTIQTLNSQTISQRPFAMKNGDEWERKQRSSPLKFSRLFLFAKSTLESQLECRPCLWQQIAVWLLPAALFALFARSVFVSCPTALWLEILPNFSPSTRNVLLLGVIREWFSKQFLS